MTPSASFSLGATPSAPSDREETIVGAAPAKVAAPTIVRRIKSRRVFSDGGIMFFRLDPKFGEIHVDQTVQRIAPGPAVQASRPSSPSDSRRARPAFTQVDGLQSLQLAILNGQQHHRFLNMESFVPGCSGIQVR